MGIHTPSISKKHMDESFNVFGMWTFPGLNEMLPGRLVREKNGEMLLSIMWHHLDHYTYKKISTVLECDDVDRVTGLLETNETVTLGSLFREKSNLISYYRVMGIALVGNKPYAVDQKWEKIRISYAGLYEWLVIDPLSIDMDNIASESFVMKHTYPKDITVKVCDDYSIKLLAENPALSQNPGRYEPNESAILEVTSSKPASINELRRQATFFRDFLIFMIGAKIKPKYIRLLQDGEDPITAFPQIRTYDYIVGEKFPELKFTYLGIKDEFPVVINEWFRVRKKYDRALDSFFESLLGTDDVDVADRFFQAIRALERISKMKNCQDKFSTSYTTKGRKCDQKMFEDLFKSTKILGIDLDHEFVRNVVNHRNNYAHGEPLDLRDEETLDLKHEKIVTFTEDVDRLILVINACIVLEMNEDVIPLKLKKKLFQSSCKNRRKKLEDLFPPNTSHDGDCNTAC